MRRKLSHTVLAISVILMFNICYGQTAFTNYLDGVVYLKVQESTSINLNDYDSVDVVFNQIISDYTVTEIAYPFGGLNDDTLDYTYKLYFEDTLNVSNMINEIELLTWVDYCEKAPLYYTSYTPNDQNASQWYLDKIKAPEAWDINKGDTNVTIAIVDNAVRISHEDLSQNTWVNNAESNNGFDSDLNGYTDDLNGYDVADQDNNPNPPSSFTGGAFSHGTHCAGTASGATNNNTGVAGVGFNCRIIGVKCTPDNSNGATLPYAYEGLKYAIDVGADIVSMSWGSRASSFTGEALINNAALNGVLMIAAAGNDNEENALSPASHQEVVSVGATNQNDEKAAFSNFGPNIDIMAPGKSIFNLFGGNDSDYGYSDGTSMACPIVAGGASLLLSNFPNASISDIKNALFTGSDEIDNLNPGYEGKLGSGRLNLYNSFTILNTESYNKKTEVKVYPNPAKKELFINLQNNLEHYNFTVRDISGREVSDNISIDKEGQNLYVLSGLNLLSEGIYFLQIKSISKSIRFIVK